VEQRNFGDVIKNHAQSGKYMTKDIDGFPYSMYDSDA
jgi:hypothetical protein